MSDAFPPIDFGASAHAPAPARTARRFAIGAAVAVLAAGWLAWMGVGEYNALQECDAKVGLSWNQVINQYMRRADLVPALVEVVRAYANQESALLDEIAATRAQIDSLAADARDGRNAARVAQFRTAQEQLTTQLARLLQVAQRYPDLRSASLYQDLMVQLEGTENRVAYARQLYFLSVADYNLGLHRFPSNLFARYAGMREKQPGALADERVLRPAAPLGLK